MSLLQGTLTIMAGNVLSDSINQYLYDAEGRICAIASTPVPSMTTMTGYIYNADGIRVAKGSISAWSCDSVVNGFHSTKDYVLGPSGEQMTEMNMGANNTMAWAHTNVWAAEDCWLPTIPLVCISILLIHSARVECRLTMPAWLNRHAPVFLTETAKVAHRPQRRISSTGKERDTESGNDYFGARYYSSAMGRFMSPDPAGMMAADIRFPQSLNRYAYVWDNPLSFTDPTGLDCAYLNSGGSGLESFDQHSSSGACGRTGGYWVTAASPTSTSCG